MNPEQISDFLAQQLPASGKVLSMVFDKTHGFEIGGSSKTLGGSFDLAILKHMRLWSDAVVTSGATVRAENYPDFAGLHVFSNENISFLHATQWGPSADLNSSVAKISAQSPKLLFETGPTLSKQLLRESLLDLVVLHTNSSIDSFEQEIGVALEIRAELGLDGWNLIVAGPYAASL